MLQLFDGQHENSVLTLIKSFRLSLNLTLSHSCFLIHFHFHINYHVCALCVWACDFNAFKCEVEEKMLSYSTLILILIFYLIQFLFLQIHENQVK